MVHADYKEMLPIHALAALDAQDDRVLTEHLASCADCRLELDEWQKVSASLAMTVVLQEPSKEVRARILSSISKSERANVVPLIPQKNVWSSLGSFGVIAAGIVFVALMISVLALWNENRNNQRRLAELATQIKTTQEQLAQQQKLIRQFTAPDAHMTELMPTTSAPGAKAMIAYDKTGHAMLIARGLPAAPAGKAYQLWYIVGTTPMPGKVFKMDEAGNGLVEDQMPTEAMKSATFAITMEDANGAAKPTGGILLHSAF
ncbi:MAG: hypothetical protein C5B55_12470 [Blastocatellia bacterium]|nr:MAG: hypothetical protein C5B55_12470 [Blastocatellia bacterium]